jgi:hypothetical protein
VRPLTDAERQTLEAGLRSPEAFTLRRCRILLASADGKNAYPRSPATSAVTLRRCATPSTSFQREEGLPEALPKRL